MALATALVRYLIRNGVSYEVVAHRPTASSVAAARRARVPAGWVAPRVVLLDDVGFLLAVIPAASRLHLGRLYRQLRRNLCLATEEELQALFKDCSLGAVPPLGAVYGLDVVVAEALLGLPHVYFDGGEHFELIKISGTDFERLLSSAVQARISGPPSPPVAQPDRQVSSAP